MTVTRTATPAAASGVNLRVIGILAGVAVGVLALDQITKALVVEHLARGTCQEVLGSVLSFCSVRNSGAAFSLAAGATWLFTIIAVVTAVGIVFYARRIRSVLWALVIGSVLGGVLGNLLDRLFREPSFGEGHVVDFISMPWMMPAIFNVADIGIVLGMSALVLLVLLNVRVDGVPRTPAGEQPHDVAEVSQLESDDASPSQHDATTTASKPGQTPRRGVES